MKPFWRKFVLRGAALAVCVVVISLCSAAVYASADFHIRLNQVFTNEGCAIQALVKEHLTQDDVPRLIEILNNEDRVDRWRDIATILGYLDEKARSEKYLIEFVLRYKDVDSRTHPRLVERFARDVMYAKGNALKALGRMGGPDGMSLLKKMLSMEGVLEETAHWEAGSHWLDYEHMLDTLQSHAAIGLVYSMDEGNIALVQAHLDNVNEILKDPRTRLSTPEEELARLSKDRDGLQSAIAEALAIREVGVDCYFNMEGIEWLRVVASYLDGRWEVETAPGRNEVTRSNRRLIPF